MDEGLRFWNNMRVINDRIFIFGWTIPISIEVCYSHSNARKYSEHNEAYSDIGQAFAYLIKAGNSNLVYLSEHLVSRSLWSQMAPSA